MVSGLENSIGACHAFQASFGTDKSPAPFRSSCNPQLKKLLAQLDLALPQRPLVGPCCAPVSTYLPVGLTGRENGEMSGFGCWIQPRPATILTFLPVFDSTTASILEKFDLSSWKTVSSSPRITANQCFFALESSAIGYSDEQGGRICLPNSSCRFTSTPASTASETLSAFPARRDSRKYSARSSVSFRSGAERNRTIE